MRFIKTVIKTDDTWGNRISWTIVKFKQRYDRGTGWISYPKVYVGIMAEVSVILMLLEKYELIEIKNIPLSFYLTLFTLYIIIGYFLGYADETHKFSLWKREIIRQNTVYNPVMQGVVHDIKEIKEELKRINSR